MAYMGLPYQINKMMFLEHVILVVCFSIIASGVFLTCAVLAQFIDIDHVFNSTTEATIYQKFNRALDSLKLFTSDGYFDTGSMGLHRGFLHRPLVFFSAFFIVIGFVGFMVGWFIHLASDGITIIAWSGF